MRTRSLTFKNNEGDNLVARLELPVDQKPQAYALFAHCFTCNKNLTAVKRISRALSQSGFGVLRFDFSGLGESEGEFADTNFSSNVEDLVTAAEFMEEHYGAPSLLVGHSLGGAAVYFAASRLKKVQAVASIAAPSSPVHVRNLLKSSLSTIKEEGSAEVEIAGRRFRIKKQLLDDLDSHTMAATVKNLRKPVLLLHSPQDTIVGIENAAEIYKEAMHPKSFVSLDGADHLLSDKRDSNYAGQLIGSWASRYVTMPAHAALETEGQVTVQNEAGALTTDIKAGNHTLRADEPGNVGGNNFGPNPYELLISSLGACTAMTIRMYASRKDWALVDVRVHLNHSKKHGHDCENCEDSKSRISYITRKIQLEGDLDEKQRQRLLQIADRCPVHRTLQSEVAIDTRLAEQGDPQP